jgi:hypothetical protein
MLMILSLKDYLIGHYNMINFDSTNIIINKYTADGLELLQYINNNQLTYIFNKYLNFIYSEQLLDSYIIYYFKINNLKLDELLDDVYLNNNTKLYLSYYMILDVLTTYKIAIITSLKYPNKIDIIFTNYNIEGNNGHIVQSSISHSFSDFNIHSAMHINQIEIDVVSNDLYTIETVNLYSPFGTF